ncbi:MAG: DMT family transporter [bacterium]|nr:DMT family transporter [bacterium]
MKDQRRATLLGLVTVLLWSTVATAFKLALRHLSPVALLAWSATASLLVLAGVVTARRGWTALRLAPRRDLLPAAGLGVINPCLYYLILFEAYDRLPAQVAQPLNYTWALTLTWLSVPLLGQRLRGRDLLAGLVCYAGVAVIGTGGDLRDWRGIDPAGVGLALGSTLLWAFYWLGNARSRLEPASGLLVNFAVGAPLVLLYGWARGDLAADGPGLLGALYVGVVEMGVTFVIWLTALKLAVNTSRVANLIFLSPFLSLVFIQFVLGEAVRPATLGGLALIVGGLVWQGRGRDQELGRDQERGR